MKIILFMSMSLNGIIADKSGSEDFLSDANWKSFGILAKKHGCFIVGRKTYEAVQEWPDFNFNSIDAKLKIVISGSKGLKLNLPFLPASSPKDAIKKAIALNFKSAVLAGGSTVASAFMAENLIDEVNINIEPIILGSGIPIFRESEFEKRLLFMETVKISKNILQVRYRVKKDEFI